MSSAAFTSSRDEEELISQCSSDFSDSASRLPCSLNKLASLTAAANAIDIDNNEILSKKQNHRRQSQSKQEKGGLLLPPISKVFPEHFGLKPPPSLTFKPPPPPNNYVPSSTTTTSCPFPVGFPPPPARTRTFQFVPAQPQFIPPASGDLRLNSTNYYHNTNNFRTQNQNDFRQPSVIPLVYHPQIDQKRPYQQQGPSAFSAPNTSIKTARSSNSNSFSCNNRNLVDIAGQGALNILVKLNFRNFAIQLSSKSTHLTSNQSGTATSDKEHFAAVMQDCVIATSVDFIGAFADYRPIVNNKLKPLKFIEFLQEQLYDHYSNHLQGGNSNGFFGDRIPPKDDLVYFYRVPDNVASKNPGMPRFRIFRHSRNLSIAIYRKGKRIFPVTPEDLTDFWLETPRNKPVQVKEKALNYLQDDDLVMICRGYADNLEDEADPLAEDASKVPIGGDLDSVLPPPGHFLDGFKGETATILAVLGSEFDKCMLQGAKHRIRHVVHIEKSGDTAFDEPWPYAITKHTLVLRPYLAMIYSDASKINRFSPTIEFILKKAKAAPVGEPIPRILGKLSEIQHMAAGLIIGDELRFWATGGAFIVHLRRENPKSFEWDIRFPGLISWSPRDQPLIPIGDIPVQDGDCLLLCCPEIRYNWGQEDIISVIQSRSSWPEKFKILTKRLKEERNSKNGLGFFEITLPQ